MRITAAVFFLLMFSFNAFADSISTLKICYSNTGAITAKKKCAKSEVTLNGSNLGAFGLQGAPGINGTNGGNGTNGANGTFDPSKCYKREASSTGSAVVTAQTACLVSEVLVLTGCTSTSPLSYVRKQTLGSGANSQYPDLYGIFTCVIEDLNGAQHTVIAQAMCCRP